MRRILRTVFLVFDGCLLERQLCHVDSQGPNPLPARRSGLPNTANIRNRVGSSS
jgi:hypothetical protein